MAACAKSLRRRALGLDLRAHYGHHQSPAIRAGGLIFCSGMLPVDPDTGERRHGTLTSEAHVIFGNLKLLLEAAGSSLARLVQVHALIYDSIEYDVFNRVYRQYVAGRSARRARSGRRRSKLASRSSST